MTADCDVPWPQLPEVGSCRAVATAVGSSGSCAELNAGDFLGSALFLATRAGDHLWPKHVACKRKCNTGE